MVARLRTAPRHCPIVPIEPAGADHPPSRAPCVQPIHNPRLPMPRAARGFPDVGLRRVRGPFASRSRRLDLGRHGLGTIGNGDRLPGLMSDPRAVNAWPVDKGTEILLRRAVSREVKIRIMSGTLHAGAFPEPYGELLGERRRPASGATPR